MLNIIMGYLNSASAIKFTNMKKSGLWYLPNSRNKIPGKLFLDNNKRTITLQLFTTSYLNGNQFTLGDTKREDNYVELILGDTSNSFLGDITLFACSFSKLAPIGGDLYQLHYSVQFVFNYVHILQRTHLKFNHIEVLYPNSDNFYNGWDSINYEEENPRNECVKVSSTFRIDDELSIDIVDSKRHKFSMSKNYEVKHTNYLKFNYNKTVDIDRVYQDCGTLKKMMEYSSRRKLAFIIKSAKIDFKNIKEYDQPTNLILQKSDDVEEKMAHTYIYSRLTLDQKPFEKRRKLHQNLLLFSAWTESQNSLHNLMKKWFDNERLHPIYDFYIDTIDWSKDGPISNVNFNNRYLNLIQGLEAYYDYLKPEYKYTNETFVAERQKVYNALESKELKKWVGNHLKFPKQPTLSSKLKFLCDRYSEVLFNLEANTDIIKSYPYKAKEYRHKLSHGKISKTFQGKDLNSLYGFSQALLCICILDSIGMEHKTIANRIDANPDINRQIPR